MVANDPSRRRLLTGMVAAPALAAAVVAMARLGSHAATMRPGGRGTSGQRCGACGGWDHTMLERACPASPQLERA